MDHSFNAGLPSGFYHSAVKAGLKRCGFPAGTAKSIAKKNKAVILRAKDIGKSKLFHKVPGNVDSCLDPKKLPGRLKWSEDKYIFGNLFGGI